ncbi:MAG: hypothetical protein A3I39_02500 [Candidatus Yanofskybacteria bacterium RIFCSPLOWO2_02_FULL_47_9b]|uniref:Protease PrsW n=1 Tax=Candidatus Yanofskybacteria bacterium RIFCSPLOWO2_02_FULL_47_9b TaxID=1802708 RepID=A0A1F8H589_9BACT|nr:MAG: hypothetical protein A3I39_02500 [Candidatus Yanofskybacteria bacterium RIFCSPLOWO2_02_FULL_47_9b]
MAALPTHTLLVISGLLPSFVWIVYFLHRDPHPEPRSLLTKTFLMGIILAPIAILFQLAFTKLGIITDSSFFTSGTASFFLWAALVEESVKFYAVWVIVLRNPAFDEPVDAMIYMIVAGLGFAAIENILFLFGSFPDGISTTLTVWGLRSVGATLLHALSSSLIGYFLALSWFFQHHRKKLIFIGITLATLFHFAFNLLISSADGRISGLGYATGLLLVMAFLVSILFVKIKTRT